MLAITGLRYIAAHRRDVSDSAALYSRIPEPYCGPGCNMALARLLIAFVLPTALAVVVGLLGLLWKRDPIRDRDAHTEATYHAIIRTVVLFHTRRSWRRSACAHDQLRSDVVKVVAHAVPVMLGLTLIVIGNLLPRLRPNIVIGIRTSRTLADRGAWARTNRTAGYAAVGAGTSFPAGRSAPKSSGHGIRRNCRVWRHDDARWTRGDPDTPDRT